MRQNKLTPESSNIPRKIGVLLFTITALLLYSIESHAQSKEIDKGEIDIGIVASEIKFISKNPIIDGELDAELKHLKARPFKYVWQFDNPVTDTVHVTYRMAYTPSHLYVYIETDVDSITYHRRGYLWGDGYKILLGIPQQDPLTNEYYELRFSPTLEKEYERYRQGMSYYNFDQPTKRLSKRTRSQEKAYSGISGFEALISWDDIKPYHPWFMKEMGYNIYFAKGIDYKELDWITNGYSLVEDEGIWDEAVPKRNYRHISFELPNSIINKAIRAKPKKSNLAIGEPLLIEVAHFDKHSSFVKLNVTIQDWDSNVIIAKTFSVQLDKALHK